MKLRRFLAIDVGGANLKAADGLGWTASRYFPLWLNRSRLRGELASLIDLAGPCHAVVATMTGELADCYTTKCEGVTDIIRALVAAAGERPVWIYSMRCGLIAPERALAAPLEVAAANWHALARFACRFAPESNSLMWDVGSTTTDIVPLGPTGPEPTGWTDPERLMAGELVYTAVLRTPVAAIVRELPWRGAWCPVASELFATSGDAYVVLGCLDEDEAARDTADGRARTCTLARRRLAHMICADEQDYSDDDARAAAEWIEQAQIEQLVSAARRVISRMECRPTSVLASGVGEFLVAMCVERLGMDLPLISLGCRLGREVSRVATSHALAVLAAEAELE